MKYLITANLIESWLEYINAEEDVQPYRECDFINILYRSGLKTNWYPQYAIAFIHGDTTFSDEPGVKEIAEIASGGVCNVTGSVSGSIEAKEYLLHYKSHVLRGPDLFRIIFDMNYYTGKYYHSSFHRIGFECLPGTKSFTYLILRGDDLFTETYNRIDTESPWILIQNFLSWLSTHQDLEKIYLHEWDVNSLKKEKDKKVNLMFSQVRDSNIADLKKDMNLWLE